MALRTIRLRRGPFAELPAGGTVSGEPRFAYDTKQLFVDDGVGNTEITPNATNVATAGAVMKAATATTGFSFVLDEDNMSSNSSTKLPTQQSVKAYVDTNVTALIGGAPTALNTLGKVSTALGGDAAFATTTSTALAARQPLNTALTQIAALSPANDQILQRKSSAWTVRTMAQLKTDLVLVKADVGLANVDNTADAAKPISTATQSALDTLTASVASINTSLGTTTLPSQTGQSGKFLTTNGTSASWATVTASGGGLSLTPTATKTANYTAAASDYVIVNATSVLTVTLPTTPADLTTVAVEIIGGTSAVTLAVPASAEFYSDGSAIATVPLQSAAASVPVSVWMYRATGNYWIPISAANLMTTTALLVDAAVTTPKVNDLAITTIKLNDLAVTNPKIADATIALGKLATDVQTAINTSPYDISFPVTLGTRAVGTGQNPLGIKLQRAVTFTSATFRCATADAIGTTTVEIRKNGTAVAGTSTSITAPNQVSGATTTGTWSFAAGDILTCAITATGTTPGTGLVVDLRGTA